MLFGNDKSIINLYHINHSRVSIYRNMDINNNLKSVNSSNDSLMVNEDQQISILGKSAPGGRSQINSVYSQRLATATLYCSGDAYILGTVKTPLKLDKGILFGDGTPTAPSITFLNDADTGMYRVGAGDIGVTTNGVTRLTIADTAVSVDVPITTPTGNLVLNPDGPSIDCTGHTLINVGGVSINLPQHDAAVITDSAGAITAEYQLASLRGGTGTDSSASSGIAHVTAGTWSYSPIVDADFGVINNFTTDQLTVNTITSVGNITVNKDLYVEDIHQATVAPALADGEAATYARTIQTADATPTALFTLPTVSGVNGSNYSVRVMISLGDATGGVDTGLYTRTFKAKNILGTLTVSSSVQAASALDGTLTGTAVSQVASGTNVLVRVTGQVGKVINWSGRFEVVLQQF